MSDIQSSLCQISQMPVEIKIFMDLQFAANVIVSLKIPHFLNSIVNNQSTTFFSEKPRQIVRFVDVCIIDPIFGERIHLRTKFIL